MSYQKAPNRDVAIYLDSFPCWELVIADVFFQCIHVFLACDAVNLMVSCSLLVFMKKNIFTVNSAPPGPLVVFRRPASKGGEWKGRRRKGEEEHLSRCPQTKSCLCKVK